MEIDVTIFEMGPRDGLQNESKFISTSDKVKLVNLLSTSGIPKIETASFVSSKWVPQMADGEQVVDDLETLVAGGVVYGGDVGDLGELGGGVVFEEGEGGNDAGGRDVDGELILPDGEPGYEGSVVCLVLREALYSDVLLDVFGQTGQQILAVLV